MSRSQTESTAPATDMRQAYRNCSPRPLRSDHPWNTDLGPARGGDLKQVRISGKAELLAEIERTHSLPEGTETLQLLYRRWIFKYNKDEWYALHPYVRSLPEVSRFLGDPQSSS